MSADIFARLAAPFPPDRVSWRVGATNSDKTKGMALAYIDARDVMDRLDEVLGPDRWQCRYSHAEAKTVCEIGVLLDCPALNPGPTWVWKADGAGDTDHEAEKGALSDAFKRAAVRWGIGRYLYDLGSPWVAIEQKGRSYVIAEHEKQKLARLLPRQAQVQTVSQPSSRTVDAAGYPITPDPQLDDLVRIDTPARRSAHGAKKDGLWEKIEAELTKASEDWLGLVAFAHMDFGPLPAAWPAQIVEAWGKCVADYLAKACHSPSELKKWVDEHTRQIEGLPPAFCAELRTVYKEARAGFDRLNGAANLRVVPA